MSDRTRELLAKRFGIKGASLASLLEAGKRTEPASDAVKRLAFLRLVNVLMPLVSDRAVLLATKPRKKIALTRAMRTRINHGSWPFLVSAPLLRRRVVLVAGCLGLGTFVAISSC